MAKADQCGMTCWETHMSEKCTDSSAVTMRTVGMQTWLRATACSMTFVTCVHVMWGLDAG